MVDHLRRAHGGLETFRRAIEDSPTAVIITDPLGNIEYVNPRFSELTGYSAEECLGRNPRFLKSGAHQEEFYRQLWHTLTEGRVWRGEMCNRKKNGELCWELASIAPVRDAEGKIAHFVAVEEDVTERRRIEQALRDNERRTNIAMDVSLLVHWELDLATRTFTFDDRFYALYGTTAEREGGSRMSAAEYARRFVPPEDRAIIANEIQRKSTPEEVGKVRRLEHRIIRADGEERFIAVCYQAERNAAGEVIRTYGANQDITERWRAAQELADAKARAEAANRDLAHSLDRQRELEKMKEQLVGLLVHDLKSPLGSVLANVSYLGADECTDSERRELISDVVAATQTMRRMVMDMLDVMRVDGVGLLPKRRPVNIASVLQEAARPAMAQARISNHRIIVEARNQADPLSIDPDLIRRVIENLLDNALKYAPAGTNIELRADIVDGQLVLEVMDEGPGIPAPERERIFEPYARLVRDDGSSARQSRGLGLTFCKLAVEAHGGQISVRDREPNGAVFQVLVPAFPPSTSDSSNLLGKQIGT